MPVIVEEPRRPAGDVVDDHVRDHVHRTGERRHVLPGTEPGIDLRMVDWIETCVAAVDGEEERQHVNAAEDAFQRTADQRLEIAEVTSGKTIDIRDQLRLVSHRLAERSDEAARLWSPEAAMTSPTAAAGSRRYVARQRHPLQWRARS